MTAPSAELLSRLLRTHGPALVLYARQWCRVPEDAVQETFLELMRQTAVPDQPRAWLYRTVRCRAINAARAAARRERHEAAARRQAWFEASGDDRLSIEEATEAIAHLPLDQREVLVARLWGGLSFEEIGQLVDVSLSTAFRRYQAAIETLRERLDAPCPRNETIGRS